MPAFLAHDKVAQWLAEVGRTRHVLAPRREGQAVVFAPLEAGQAPDLSAETTMPPKKAVFPTGEQLFGYSYVKDADKPGATDVSISLPPEPQPALVFGSRPCGARGFVIFDKVYDTARIKDETYAARRQATVFASIACRTPGNTCFCHWVGSGPSDAAGSDLLLQPLEGNAGYVVEAVNDKGQEVLTAAPLPDATPEQLAQAQAGATATQALLDKQSPAPDLAGAPAALLGRFDDLPFWEAQASKCISCGACTYLCPTCYCFTITDEPCGTGGKRLRSWDTCMSYQYTLEASGHNPRPTKAHRLKNRVGHKFSYYPEIHGGTIACCGCGRCIKLCPASVDIREIVLAAMAPKAEQPVEEAAK